MVDRNDIDDDLDEPMASQSVDAEAPLTHNSSKNNFFASPDEQPTAQVINTARGSFKNAVRFFFLSFSFLVLIFHNFFFNSLRSSRLLF